jgi:3',5'-cyclic-AMP phosphodiesterase
MQRRNLLKNLGLLSGSTLIPSISQAKANISPKHVLRIAHITDVHIQGMVGAVKGFEKCLHHMQNLDIKVDFIINSGDCIMDAHGIKTAKVQNQWELFQNVIKSENSLPIYNCIGNHDICCEGESGHTFDDGKKWAMDEMAMEKPFYSFDKNNWHFVTLDSVQKKNDGSWYTAHLGEEQTDWLKTDIENTSKNTMIISHIPILSACVFFDGNNMKEGKWEVPGSWMHTDSKQISELFYKQNRVKLAVSGHIHLTDRVDYAGTSYLCNGAVSGKWWFGKYQHTPAGYAIIDLYDDGSFVNNYVEYQG